MEEEKNWSLVLLRGYWGEGGWGVCFGVDERVLAVLGVC